MLGLMVLLAAVVYFVVLLFAMYLGWRLGRASGSKWRTLVGALIGFLVAYLPVFWDHIPTVLAHRHFCAKDGGLTVYKAPDQWLAEHKDELETLRVKAGGEPVRQKLTDGWERMYLINKLVALERHEDVHQFLNFVAVRRSAERLVEVSTGQNIALNVQYGVGNSFQSGGLKVWLYRPTCNEPSDRPSSFYLAQRKLTIQEIY